MVINTYSNWGFNVLNVVLTNENFLSTLAKSFDFSFLDVFTFLKLDDPLV